MQVIAEHNSNTIEAAEHERVSGLVVAGPGLGVVRFGRIPLRGERHFRPHRFAVCALALNESPQDPSVQSLELLGYILKEYR